MALDPDGMKIESASAPAGACCSHGHSRAHPSVIALFLDDIVVVAATKKASAEREVEKAGKLSLWLKLLPKWRLSV